MLLKPFQVNAINNLKKSFFALWQTNDNHIELTFKSPTGSGKTIMIAQFLKEIATDVRFDVDKCFLWISFNEESYDQSKKKLLKYYGGISELNLLDLNDINKGRLENNDIFFVNWQKIKANNKEQRNLRKSTEINISFDDLLSETIKENRDRVLIIDESHRDSNTVLAKEIINIINPKIIINVSATPEEPSIGEVNSGKKGFVEVLRENVVESGLIKEKIIVQTTNELLNVNETDEDLILLELAFSKREELKRIYRELDLDINPLVLIQLPNDDKETKVVAQKYKIDIVKDFLSNKGVSSEEIAIWLDKTKVNLEDIEMNNSKVSFLLFKQAAATGWDCPRSIILVMFREIKEPKFHTQTVGRILRMPEGIHYPTKPALNIGYLYTNYSRNEINLPDNKYGANKPYLYLAKKTEGMKDIVLTNTYIKHTDYGDLGASFQNTLVENLNNAFNISLTDSKDSKISKIREFLDLENIEIRHQMIVNAEIVSYDNFLEQMKRTGQEIQRKLSFNNLEKTYDLLCYKVISEQTEELKKYAPERSWGKLKSALNVWFRENLSDNMYYNYSVIVTDFLKNSNSILKRIIIQSLEDYHPIRTLEIETKRLFSTEHFEWKIPEELSFTDDFEELVVLKSIMKPFFIKKSYVGKGNETSFIEFLEDNPNVEWWFKNGDLGREYFAIPYVNETTKRTRLFYVDFIVKLSNGKIALLDTKKGNTAELSKDKSKGLYDYVFENESLIGGIVVNSGGLWLINNKKEYTYNVNNLSEWIQLNELFL